MLHSEIESLNEQQREAVLHSENPLLILAGAGSGKTRVITFKIAWFIEKHGVDPRSILAVTFTNKAADELRTRALSLSPEASGVNIRTFHSFGAWLLRRNSAVLELSENFTIYDDNDSLTLLSHLYPDRSKQQLGYWNHCISRAKDNCLSYNGNIEQFFEDSEIYEVYTHYENYLRQIGNVDFGDLILRPIELLKNEDIVADRIRSRFSVILVDEYQDSNFAQSMFLQELFQKGNYICVVGDDDQSIYRFRGAEVRNILDFPQQFRNADIIKLEQNYRSTGYILDLASNVVRQNTGRYGKTLWTNKKGGKKPLISGFYDEQEELEFIASLVQDNFSGNTAILYRANPQEQRSRKFETYFVQQNIDYKIIGTLRFFDREEVKDAVALLKLIANPRDIVAFTRIINKPARGIGAVTVKKILEYADSNPELVQALDRVLSEASGVASKARAGIQAFISYIRTAADLLQKEGKFENLGMFLRTILEMSGLVQHYLSQDEISGTGKIQNLEELMNAASLYPSKVSGLVEFLESIELDATREQNNTEAQVILITMHNTKGLEFDRVIITGLEDGQFPRADDKDEIEEERRLFYVAITRARKELYLTYCAQRRINGRLQYLHPSMFLDGIENSDVEFSNYAVKTSLESNPWQFWNNSEISRNITENREYPPGQLVYHEEYGTGEVIKSSYNGVNEIIHVRFETGKVAQFIPRYALIEKISRD